MEYFTAIRGICLILAIILFGSAGCISDDTEEGPTLLTAAVTILPQQEFVEKVGGERVRTIVMIPPGASPATYSPVPEEVKTLSQANVYFEVGTPLPFEDVYLERLLAEYQDMVVVNCSEKINLQGNDPHVWTNPKNAIQMVNAIAGGLCDIDPQNATYYRNNAGAYIKELNSLDGNIRSVLEPVSGKAFLVYHPAWSYFAREYSLVQVSIENEGKEPGSRELAEIISMAKKEGINEVYANPQMNTEPARFIAEQIGGELVYADPLSKDYISNLERFAISLSGSEI